MDEVMTAADAGSLRCGNGGCTDLRRKICFLIISQSSLLFLPSLLLSSSKFSLIEEAENMAYQAMKPTKAGLEEPLEQIHKIRITLSSKNVKNLQKARQFLITPLKDLRPFKTAWRIQVKILHAYKQYSLKSGETIELIIADESGAKMSVTVRKEHVKKFERCLVVGSWKIITTMTLNPVTGNYRVSDLRYKIAFLYNTAVAPSEVVNDSKFFSFATFDAILAGTLNNNILVDVIGHIADCGELKDLITNNKSNRKIDFNLLDVENNRVPCTLWGKFAEMIDEANQKSTDGMVICLIRFAKLGVFNGLTEYDHDDSKAKALEAEIGIRVLRHRVKKPTGTAEEVEKHFGCTSSELIME